MASCSAVEHALWIIKNEACIFVVDKRPKEVAGAVFVLVSQYKVCKQQSSRTTAVYTGYVCFFLTLSCVMFAATVTRLLLTIGVMV